MNEVSNRLDPRWRTLVPADWLDGWSPRSIAVEGGAIEGVEMGTGPTLVLLPPVPGYKESWIRVAPLLARRFRVVTMDVRVSRGGQAQWSELIADLTRVLEALAPGAFHLVGHSMGGALAQRWSLAHPERVRSLVLSSSFARVTHPRGNRWARFVEQPLVVAGQRLLPEATAQEVARRLARRYAWVYDPRCDDHVLAFVRHCMRATTWPQTRACLELLFHHDTRRDLGHLRVPTLVVVGERESVFARGAADELCALIPGVAFDVSPEVSHLHPLSSPDWLAQRISDWVISHSGLD